MPRLRLTFKFHLPPSPPFFPPFRRPCCYKNTFRKICYFSSKTPPIPPKQQKKGNFHFLPSLPPSAQTQQPPKMLKVRSPPPIRFVWPKTTISLQFNLFWLVFLLLFSFSLSSVDPSILQCSSCFFRVLRFWGEGGKGGREWVGHPGHISRMPPRSSSSKEKSSKRLRGRGQRSNCNLKMHHPSSYPNPLQLLPTLLPLNNYSPLSSSLEGAS